MKIMNERKKLIILLSVFLLVIFIFVSPGHALFKRDMKKAKGFINDGSYAKAIPLLEKAVLEHTVNAEAHFLLGISYINNDNLRYAGEVFSSAVRLEPDYGTDIGREYKKAADRAFVRGDILSACSLFEKALEYDQVIEKRETHSIYSVIDGETGSAEFYKNCNVVSQVPVRKQNQTKNDQSQLAIEKRSVREPEKIESEIKQFIKHKKNEYLSSSRYSVVVFEKTYTFDDAFENIHGQIRTIKFGKDNIRIGDQIEVVVQLKDGSKFRGKEIGIWNGDKNRLIWERTKNGYHSEIVKETQKGIYTISLAKRRDITVVVRIQRKLAHKPIKDFSSANSVTPIL
jgi:tetratricopeptide (TPR) repeat protein